MIQLACIYYTQGKLWWTVSILRSCSDWSKLIQNFDKETLTEESSIQQKAHVINKRKTETEYWQHSNLEEGDSDWTLYNLYKMWGTGFRILAPKTVNVKPWYRIKENWRGQLTYGSMFSVSSDTAGQSSMRTYDKPHQVMKFSKIKCSLEK